MNFEKRLKIYCIDDDPEILAVITGTVAELGFTPKGFASASAALAQIEHDLDELIMIVCDFKMPEMTGLELRERTLALTKNIPFVILSGYISREEALRAVNLKLSGFLDKPVDEKLLRELIRKETAELVATLKDEHEMVLAFLGDAETLIEQLEDRLLALETQPANHETLNQVFAVAHTIKGGSGFIRPDTLHHFMHRFEDFLSQYKRQAIPVDSPAISRLMKALDLIKRLVEELKTGERSEHDLEKMSAIFTEPLEAEARGDGASAAAAAGGPAGGPAKAQDEIRVSTALLDRFMGLSGEITVIRNMINKLVGAIEKDVPGNKDVQLLSELLDEMHKINSVMQDSIIDLRKVPLKSVFRPLPRALRDVATVLKKDIRLEFAGDDLRVDNSIAEVLGHSLIHMVRNGADHAIEAKDERLKRGKNAHGLIRISAAEKGDFVHIDVNDDGKGLDHEMIKNKAISSHLITREQAQKMTPAELRLLIFASGFSTAAKVTDISGRGVGMDMVMKEVTRIGGRIEIDSTVGRGSKFSLILPVPKSVNIISALVVRSGDESYCLPQDDIYRLLSVPVEEFEKAVRRTDGADFLALDGGLFPLVNLRETLAGKAGERVATSVVPRGYTVEIALLRAGATVFGLVVDEIIDIEDTVVKNLGRHLRSLGVYGGATFLGDGRVGLILNPQGIAALNRLGTRAAREGDDHGATADTAKSHDSQLKELVIFELRHPGLFGVYLDDIFRLEHFGRQQVQYSGGQAVVIYRGEPMALIDLSKELGLSDKGVLDGEDTEIAALVVKSAERCFGFAVTRISDLQMAPPADPIARDREGVLGASLLGERTVTIVDTKTIVSACLARLQPGREHSEAS